MDSYVDPDAPAPLTSMTLQLMVQELSALRYVADELTLDYMIDRYGLILPEKLDALLPEVVREMKIMDLVGSQGKDTLLKSITVESLLALIPEGTISEPAVVTLGNKTLYEVMEADLGYLLTGVHLGYLVGVNYTKDEAGNFIVDPADPEHLTMFELIAPVDVGELLSVLSDGGDMMGVFRKSIGNVMVLTLLETITGTPSDLMASIMDGKTLEDILVLDEVTGTYTIKLDGLLKGQLLGDLLGYTPVWSETDPPFIREWQQDGVTVTGYMRGLASVDAGVILTEDFEPSALFGDVYLGDFLNYTPVVDATGEIVDWTDASGAPIGKAYRTLAMKSVEEMTSGGMEFDTLFAGIYVGDFYGYVYDEEREVWTDEVSEGVYEDVTGVNRVLAKIEIGKLLADGDYDISSEFEGMQLGELLGYTKEGDDWYQEVSDAQGGVTLEKVGAMESVIADTDAGDLMSGEFDISSEFEGMQLGELLGYTKEGDDWYQEVSDGQGGVTLEKVGAMESVIANMDAGDLMNGNLDISSEFEGMQLGELLGYTKVGDDWYQEVSDGQGGVTLEKVGAMESAIADADAGDLMSGNFDVAETYRDVFVGDMMEYTRGEEILPEGGVSPEAVEDREYNWYKVYDEEHPENNELVTGMEAKLANYSLYKLIKGEAKLDADTVTEGMTVAEILGLHEKVCYVYDANGEPIMVNGERVTVSLWYDDDGAKANGVIGAMAQKEFSQLVDADEGFDTLYIGEVLGQVKIGAEGETAWYTLGEVSTYTEGECEEYRVTATPATGMMTNLSDLTVGDMSDNDKVTEKIQSVKVGEAMGWTRIERIVNGETVVVWYTTYDPVTGIGEEATGTMATLADYAIGDLDSEIDSMPVGKLLGYKEVDGKWYEVYDAENPENNKPADGVMKAIAGISVNNLSSEINTIKIGEIMGWTLVEDGENTVWYEVYDEENPENNKQATGIMAAFADLTMDEMSDGAKVSEVVRTVKVGDAMGWTLYDGVWYETFVAPGDPENVVAEGTLAALADYPIGDINQEIKNLEVGKLLGWTKDGDTWVDEDGNPVEGLMKVVAGYKVNELSSEINNIKIGTIMDWTPVEEGENTVWYEVYDEEYPENNKQATGIMAAFADLTMDEMSDGAKVSEVVRAVKVGDAMGWTLYDGVWYETFVADGDPANVVAGGTLAALADYPIGDINEEIKNLEVGKLLGWTKDGDKWLDEDGNAVDGLMKVVAGYKVNELSSEINNIKIGTIMDWTPVETVPGDPDSVVWYEIYDEEHPENNKEASGIMAGFADLTMDEMSDAETVSGVVQDLKLGDAMGWTKVGDVWYKSYDAATGEGEKATGTMGALADYKVSEIDSKIMDLSLGDAMGWYPVSTGQTHEDGTEKNKWYKDADCTEPVTGFMAVVADYPIGEIEGTIQMQEAGVMLGYEYRVREDETQYSGQMWWHSVETDGFGNTTYQPVSKMTNTICKMKIDEMGTAVDNISIGDVYDYSPEQDQALTAKLNPFLFDNPETEVDEGDWKNLGIKEFCDIVVLVLTWS